MYYVAAGFSLCINYKSHGRPKNVNNLNSEFFEFWGRPKNLDNLNNLILLIPWPHDVQRHSSRSGLE